MTRVSQCSDSCKFPMKKHKLAKSVLGIFMYEDPEEEEGIKVDNLSWRRYMKATYMEGT